MTPAKRAMDLVLALALAGLLAPLMLGIWLWIRLAEGAPALHVSERMRGVDRPFRMWKFRTMRAGAGDGLASGGHKAGQVTRSGRLLRRARLDELPQLWNVLRGDMSFVGPRPPLRRYTRMFPALYAEVLRCRPGITGLATLYYHRHEERLLAGCASGAETDRTYARRCIPRKARLDLIYARRRSLALDLKLLAMTLARAAGVSPRGGSACRRRRRPSAAPAARR
jgi:lipopolysaccharide/colanic/teichoic acid biosynthesis glycosyltransferase